MVLNMPKKVEISPSLRDIVNHFDDDYRRPSDTFYSETKPAEQIGEYSNNDTEFGGDTFDNGGTWDFDHDDQTSVVDEGTCVGEQILPSHYEVLDILLMKVFFFLNIIIFSNLPITE